MPSPPVCGSPSSARAFPGCRGAGSSTRATMSPSTRRPVGSAAIPIRSSFRSTAPISPSTPASSSSTRPPIPISSRCSRVLGVDSCELRHVFCGLARRRRARIFGRRRRRPLRPAANLVRPRFWSMLADLVRFYRSATRDAAPSLAEEHTLGDYLAAGGYGAAFRGSSHRADGERDLVGPAGRDPRIIPLPPSCAFIDNHGLLRLSGRPVWRTVVGGSRGLCRPPHRAPWPTVYGSASAPSAVERIAGRGRRRRTMGGRDIFDQVVIATHADEALALLAEPERAERALLGAFRYSRNEASCISTDADAAPPRGVVELEYHLRRGSAPSKRSVTYWMNALQRLPTGAERVRHAQSARAAARAERCASRPTIIRSSTPRAIAAQKRAVEPARGGRRLVLRRAFRRRLSRGRPAGGPRGRRATRRRTQALAGRERVRAHRRRRRPSPEREEAA